MNDNMMQIALIHAFLKKMLKLNNLKIYKVKLKIHNPPVSSRTPS